MITNEDVARAVRLADELEEGGDLRGALAVITETCSRASARPKLHALKGRLLYLLGHHEAAIQSFDAALALKPSAATTLYFRARAKTVSGDTHGALADFTECLRLEPDSADALYQIAAIHEGKGDRRQALQFFEAARMAGGDVPEDLSQRIEALRQAMR